MSRLHLAEHETARPARAGRDHNEPEPMAKAKERVNKRNIFQLQERFQKFCTRCDFSVTMRSVDTAATVSRRREDRSMHKHAYPFGSHDRRGSAGTGRP
jgi:hypothetical protein